MAWQSVCSLGAWPVAPEAERTYCNLIQFKTSTAEFGGVLALNIGSQPLRYTSGYTTGWMAHYVLVSPERGMVS